MKRQDLSVYWIDWETYLRSEMFQMNMRVVAFRAFLVLFVASFLVCGGFGIFEAYRAADYEDQLAKLQVRYSAYWAACGADLQTGRSGLEENKTSGNCRHLQYLEDSRSWLRAESQRHSDRAETYLLMAIVLPLSIAISFYALRWIITGQLRPYWNLRDE